MKMFKLKIFEFPGHIADDDELSSLLKSFSYSQVQRLNLEVHTELSKMSER